MSILNISGKMTLTPHITPSQVNHGVSIVRIYGTKRPRYNARHYMSLACFIQYHVTLDSVTYAAGEAPWWRHQMEIFSALLAICAGNSPVTSEFSTQRPVPWSCDVFFDPRLNKRLIKQWWGWWFETLSRPLWRHCNYQYTNWCTYVDAECMYITCIMNEIVNICR